MSKLKFVFALAVMLAPLAIAGCGGNETNVVPQDPEMDAAAEEAYEQESYGENADDASQN
ncbi:hypothetical protein [Roseiconus lacunae]|uniref:Secreted protein n=1 Tax=Roseiconus lacunae TaxID=2605694 RepID=A0ABT7PK99_9BACT|nr:hypothetical protein [Roseiconus lacunae]MCD0461010.1 hypothetical protein [Roseiconus lacunae]MDM4016914.1 hypothetical protein [Roseiconus lacunae]WRQ48850.1 hypothetical protein U8335_18000 [Stieleria sp. HD01]